MLSLDILTRGQHCRLLVVHAESGAVIWDVRCALLMFTPRDGQLLPILLQGVQAINGS